jgi:AraC-like DNA-binding protein
MVEYGHCDVTTQHTQRIALSAGEMAICFGGDAHQIGVGAPSLPMQIADLLGGATNDRHPDATGRSADAALTCGVFLLHNAQFNPLIEALPSVVRTSLTRSGELHNFSGVARLLHHELDRPTGGSSYVIERLLEVLCAEALRAHTESLQGADQGWFRGIQDPIVGRALAGIHARPGESWTVDRMAAEVAISPSRFAARFRESLGTSPMGYLTRWRMNIACRRLRSTLDPVERIAVEVGYESPAAFNRAFRKHLGLPPATWRKRCGREAESLPAWR